MSCVIHPQGGTGLGWEEKVGLQAAMGDLKALWACHKNSHCEEKDEGNRATSLSGSLCKIR